jgi:hypothetical protein
MVKEIDPRLVFERLFSSGSAGEAGANRARRQKYRQSVLDTVTEDAKRLKNQLGAGDQNKLDEYLTGIREIEQRLARTEKDNAAHPEPPRDQTTAFTKAMPKDYQEHIRLMGDVLALALQSDLTRVATYVFANEGSNRSYRFLEVPEGHHDLSHHGRDPAKMAKIQKINQFHMTQFAYFLGKLKGIREGEGTLLDNCMILYGSGNGDGNRHNHDNLPILLAGKGGGTLKTGRHVQYEKETPLTNLYLSLLDRMGVHEEKLGDSTGRLGDLV